MKHTKGKWTYILSGDTHAIVTVVDEKGNVAAHIYNANFTEETLANAKLIAAAPTMLQTLEYALTIWDYDIWLGPQEQEIYRAIKEAIKKATE